VPGPICEGLTVLEMGSGSMAGSMAGMMLADNGARVIKVEPPEGDRFRRQHPSAFLVWNRGKESVVADLRTTAGQAEARELARGADVVIEAFSPGVAERWGLGSSELRGLNPALVYCSVRGFGAAGPFSDLKAYDGVIAAKAGLFTRGAFGFRPGPIFVNAPVASHGAAHMATAGILSALLVREQTGRGQDVEASLWQGLNPYDYFGLTTYQNAIRSGTVPTRGAPSAAGVVASRFSPMGCSADGRWVISCTMLPHQGQAFVRGLGLAEALTDPRFKATPFFDSVDDAEAYDDLVWARIRELDSRELTEMLLAEPDVAFEIAGTAEDALSHPQVVHNGEVIEVVDPELGVVHQVGPVAHFESTPARIARSRPALGAHHGPTTGPEKTPATGPAPAHPLAGVTIVEFGYFYAMPYGVTMAAALGARVIKLEDGQGDPMRRSFGAMETGASKVLEGKESIALDLKSPEGRRIVHQIVESADVFVLGFRPGVAERLGIDYETLRAVNPRLVYVHAGGYGPSGPYAQRPMYAQTAAALAGGYDRQAGYWLRPEMSEGFEVAEIRAILAPRIQSLAEGDANAALGVLSAIMFGIFSQRRSGTGQFIASSMINGNLWALSDDFCRYEGKPTLARSDPDLYGLSATYRLYETVEGWMFLAATTEREWAALVAETGSKDLATDPRFSDAGSRSTNDDELAEVLSEILAARPAAQWEQALTAAGVGCAAVYDGSVSQFTATTPALLEAGLTFEVDDPTFGRVVRYGTPVKMSETPGRVAPGCLRGQHNNSVLGELGYSPTDIEKLKEARIVLD
jgi:crotonobetainyl-CoA:carnitine CoA-transferase CaiB-like acyl-CoA transferase